VTIADGATLEHGDTGRSPRVGWARPLAAAALSVLLYASTLDNPFVYDDYRLIVENPTIQQLSDLAAVFLRDITRPLVNLTYIADTAIWGSTPFGYHLTNVVLHGLNVVLMFWVAFGAAEDWRRKGGGRVGFGPSPVVVATATSLLVAAHPALTQAVGYVTGRSELLYGCFALCAWSAARRWMHGGSGWWCAGAVSSWLLALAGKETAAMLPVVLWAYDAWLIEDWTGVRPRRVRRCYAPLTLLVLAFGAGRLAVLGTLEYPQGAGPDWRYALVAVDAFWQSVALFVWPRGQTLIHTVTPLEPTSLRAIAGATCLVGLVGVVWLLRRVQAVIGLGLLVCVLMLVPSGVLFTMGVGEPMAEHRAYVSGMGFFLSVGAAAGLLWERASSRAGGRRACAAVAVVLVAQLSGLTLVRNAVWASPVALAQEAVTLSPGHWLPHLLLGETLRQAGRCDDAIAPYRASLERRPQETFTRKKLVSCLLLTGRIVESERELQALRQQEPGSNEAAMGLGLLAIARGQGDASRQYFAQILAHDPAHAEARQFVALLDGTLGASERAALCGLVRTLGEMAAYGTHTAAQPVCP
jgi:hypothetical protein